MKNKLRLGNVLKMVALAALTSCNSSSEKHDTALPMVKSEHMIEMQGEDNRIIFIDRVDNKMLLQPDSSSEGNFVSFRVEFADSAFVSDDKERDLFDKHFQFRFQQDWKILMEGDSVIPVFFQPSTPVNKYSRDGILVFEVKKNFYPDTLIYQDSNSDWGKHVFVFRKN